MQFNSLHYFGFLLVTALVYWRLNFRHQNLFLVAVSYAFYAVWDWRFLGLMVFATAIGFYPALAIKKAQANGNALLAKRWMVTSVVASLGTLAVFKYANFFVDGFMALLARFGGSADSFTLGIVLPVGISFYIFHTISYVVDVYQEKLEPTNFFSELALFLAFYPQLIAGPIARAGSLLPQCSNPRTYRQDDIVTGIYQILVGLFRKVVVADSAAALADRTFSNPTQYNQVQLLCGLLLYSIQIYNDFAGYSDLARGSAKMFGFSLIKNFDLPYFAQNISDFWKKWHISLSSWLRDYLYIPLGGSRKGKFRTYFNLMATMTLGGLWHGASWNFVFWGFLHGSYLCLYHLYKESSFKLPTNRFLQEFASPLLVFGLATFTWLFFRSPSEQVTAQYLKGLVSGGLAGGVYWLVPTAIIIALHLLPDLAQKLRNKDPFFIGLKPTWATAFAFVMLVCLVASGDLPSQPFIYFQF